MNKFLLLLAAAGLMSCSFPIIQLAARTSPTAESSGIDREPATNAPTPQPGSDANPLILALAPSEHPKDEMIEQGEKLAAQLQSLTNYTIVTVAPGSEVELLEALTKNNAHIAVLSPFAYLLARESGTATAGLASVKAGEPFYGAQFIANRESEFDSFYDELLAENSAAADEALAQFDAKKPCWSDDASPSGFVIPLGFLRQADAKPRAGAFLAGQPPVVRAVYAEDICDFGATFIDARRSPALEADYPDVLEKVVVIWQIPAIIPYETISFSTSLPLEMRRALVRAFVDAMTTEEGKIALQTVYGMEALEAVDDSRYDEFQLYAQASGIDLWGLLEE